MSPINLRLFHAAVSKGVQSRLEKPKNDLSSGNEGNRMSFKTMPGSVIESLKHLFYKKIPTARSTKKMGAKYLVQHKYSVVSKG